MAADALTPGAPASTLRRVTAPAGTPRFIAALLLVLGLLATPGRARGEPTGARILESRGQAVVHPARGAEAAAAVGDVLAQGSRLRTGADGLVVLALAEGITLRLAPSSSLLVQASPKPGGRLRLVVPFGRVAAVVRAPASDLVIATPSAVCSVHGTELEVQVADDGAVRVLVREGSVAVDADTGQSLVAAGQELEADERSMSLPVAASGLPPERWLKARSERLRAQASLIVDALAARLTSRLTEIDALAAGQRDAASRRDAARARVARGDDAAGDDVRRLERRLAEITGKLELVGAQATAELGHAARLQDLAVGPLAPTLAPRLRDKAALVQAVKERVEATLDESARVVEPRPDAVLAVDTPEVAAPAPLPDARALEQGHAAVARLRGVVDRLRRRLDDARDERDVVALGCIDEKLAAARSLLDAAASAEAALLEAVSRRDGDTAAHQVEMIDVARARGDRLLAQGSACVGARAVYAGETSVELVHDAPPSAAIVPPASRGGTPAASHP